MSPPLELVMSDATGTPRTEVDGVALAKILRCDEAAVRKYAQRGIIHRGKGGYPLFESIGNVVEHLRQQAGGHGTAEAMHEGAGLKRAQREFWELRVAKQRSQLISMPAVETLWTDIIRSVQTMFRSFPTRARHEMPQLTREDITTLERLAAKMLQELALKGQAPLPKDEDEDDADDESVATAS